MSTDFNLDAYLNRIAFNGARAPTLQVLAALQAAHVHAIPFEGLDRLMGIPVSLEPDALQTKIVQGLRGGNCFENNLLLQAALQRIGFKVRGLGARVRWMSAPDDPMGPREHMLLLVELPEGPKIVDVGFGACIIDEPLSLAAGIDQRTAMGTFRLDVSDGLYTLNAQQPSGWRAMYCFGLEPQFLSDYVMANTYAPHNPRLPFLTNLVAERVAQGKRYKLINRTWLVEARDGECVEKNTIGSAQELGDVLETHFRVRSPVPLDDLFAKTPS